MLKTTPALPPVTQHEFDVWAEALRRGAGTHAEVARLLSIPPVTWARRRLREEGEYEWWWRDVFNACSMRIRHALHGEMIAARKDSARYNRARERIRRMDKHLDEHLRPEWLDAVQPPLMLSSALAQAKTFLQEQLARGPVLARVVHKRAKDRGIAQVTLARMRARMGIISRQRGFGKDKVVTWELPPDADD